MTWFSLLKNQLQQFSNVANKNVFVEQRLLRVEYCIETCYKENLFQINDTASQFPFTRMSKKINETCPGTKHCHCISKPELEDHHNCQVEGSYQTGQTHVYAEALDLSENRKRDWSLMIKFNSMCPLIENAGGNCSKKLQLLAERKTSQYEQIGCKFFVSGTSANVVRRCYRLGRRDWNIRWCDSRDQFACCKTVTLAFFFHRAEVKLYLGCWSWKCSLFLLEIRPKSSFSNSLDESSATSTGGVLIVQERISCKLFATKIRSFPTIS